MIPGYRQAFFIHIPKTAGESFARLLRDDAGLGEVLRIPPDSGFFPALLTAHRYPVIHGHAPHPVATVLREPLFVMTFLRSPVERVVSQYEYLHRSDLPAHQDVRRVWRERGIETIDDLVGTGRSANLQTVMLGADYELAPILERFRQGRLSADEARREMQRASGGPASRDTLERAKARLERMPFVGITEAFDDSARLFASIAGLGSDPPEHRTNVAPESVRAARNATYEGETLEAIADANRLDAELYDFAVAMFRRRYEDVFGEEPVVRRAAIHAEARPADPSESEPVTARGIRPGARGRSRRRALPHPYAQGLFIDIPGNTVPSFNRIVARLAAPDRTLVVRPGATVSAIASAPDFLLVRGRLPFAAAELLRQPLLLITMLRDPVPRAMAVFEHGLRRRDAALFARLAERGATVSADLVASRIPANVQTRLLGADLDLRSLVERSRRGKLTTDEAEAELRRRGRAADRSTLDRAISRLESIQVVGIAERPAQACRRLGNLIGKGGDASGASQGELPAPALEYDEAALSAIADANRLDMELYELAVDLGGARSATAGGTTARA